MAIAAYIRICVLVLHDPVSITCSVCKYTSYDCEVPGLSEATLYIGGVKRQLYIVCLLESVLVGLCLSLTVHM